ncbi:FMN-binding protein [Dasania marina]|uniref:FMN-binding protein n=1 Tax=Dasania marina TaxID=471499 RepID=UPI0030DC1FE1|tara:strand:+ start:5256 stop:5792 length:537 start_codon:yes stop_codon:yes gene_type:complete
MKVFIAVLLLLLSSISWAQKGQFISVADYQARFFADASSWQTLWVDKSLRAEIESIIGRRFSTLRLRYWGDQQRTGWVLEEIGKEFPITVGVVVDAGKIIDLSILEYRESRGGEVRYPFFTQQFNQVALAAQSQPRLDKSIDGITGATLSVRALQKIATLALFLHQQTPFNQPISEGQ